MAFFHIGETPCTPDNKLDLDCLAAGVKFCNRGGVQTRGTVDAAVEYAKHAGSQGADAIISRPPENADANAMLEYHKTIGKATGLPLFVQSAGDRSLDLVVLSPFRGTDGPI